MTMRSRLRKLLRQRSRLRKESSTGTTTSSTLGGMGTDTDHSSISTVQSAEKTDYQNHHVNNFDVNDPYADVRDRLEKLSSYDKNRAAQGLLHTDEGIPNVVAYLVYLSYGILIFMGHLRDFCATILQRGRYLRQHTGIPSDDLTYYAMLLKSWENFFTRRLYNRIQDVFNRPIASNPGANITVLERVSDDGQKSMRLLGSLDNLDHDMQRHEYLSGPHYVQAHDGSAARSCLNLGSYNYLGFADDWSHTCAAEVKGSLHDLPVSVSSSRNEYGTTHLHRELEKLVAEFLNKPDALVLNMGFNTNATTIPALMGRGDLLISEDQKRV